jgi:hypothetical protein
MGKDEEVGGRGFGPLWVGVRAGSGGRYKAGYGDCDALGMRAGRWTEEAERVAGSTVGCLRCYLDIRRRSPSGKG